MELTHKLRMSWTERKTRDVVNVVGGMLLGIMLATCISAAQATAPNPDHKVTLCHRTGSATNPYVVITTDIASDGYVKGGHDQHEQVGNGLGGDIIPAYEYVSKKDGSVFDYPGKNLDFVFPNGETGAEVLAAGCVLTDESPSPSPSETESPTPSPTETETPTPTPTKTRTHTPTWTPTWTPTHRPPTNSQGVRRTAMTGGDWALPAAAGLALAGLGGGTLYLRRRSMRSI
jgi:hypothetical protein